MTRQYRRMIFTTISGMLAYAVLFGTGAEVAIGGLAGLGLSVALIAAHPASRHWSECIGLGAVGGVLLTQDPAMAFAAAAVLSLMAQSLIYGTILDYMPLRFKIAHSQAATLPHKVEALWTKLVADAGHPDEYYSGDLVDYDHDPDDEETVYLRLAKPGEPIRDVTLTYLYRLQPFFCRYFIEQDEAGMAGDMTVTLTMASTGPQMTTLRRKAEQTDLPLRIAMAHWFDRALHEDFRPLTVGTTPGGPPRTKGAPFASGFTFPKRGRTVSRER